MTANKHYTIRAERQTEHNNLILTVIRVEKEKNKTRGERVMVGSYLIPEVNAQLIRRSA